MVTHGHVSFRLRVRALTMPSERGWWLGSALRQCKPMSSVRRSHHRKPWPATTLDADEQSELALKLRYGIGLEQLVGEADAQAIRRHLPRPSARRVLEQPPEQRPSDPVVLAAAVRRFGRGYGLGRMWRR